MQRGIYLRTLTLLFTHAIQINRFLRDIINDTTTLTYQIELSENGLVDGDASLPASDKLKRLRSYRESWLTLRWSCEESGTLCGDDPSESTWALCSGYLAECQGVTGSNFDLYRRQLPAVARGIASTARGGPCYHIPPALTTGYVVHDFTIDPSQDLLLLTWCVPSNPLFLVFHGQAANRKTSRRVIYSFDCTPALCRLVPYIQEVFSQPFKMSSRQMGLVTLNVLRKLQGTTALP